jgi:hypothetical protein
MQDHLRIIGGPDDGQHTLSQCFFELEGPSQLARHVRMKMLFGSTPTQQIDAVSTELSRTGSCKNELLLRLTFDQWMHDL